MNKTLPLLAAAIMAGSANAQVSFGGEPIGTHWEKMGLPKAATVVMPEVDAKAMIAEDEARAAAGIKGPYRFGFNHATDLALDNSGTWNTLKNGDRLWRLAIECPQAFSINFEFSTYVVPAGGKVFVYNDAGDFIGAFTAESNPGHAMLGVQQVAGSRITVEYQEPAAMAGQGALRIGQVTHAYRDVFGLMKDLGDSGPCNNNVVCPVGIPWENEINSVAIITVGGSGLCTGQLLNNCASDGTPYFLTANHCVSGGVGGWVFRFNWESPTCTPTQNGPTNQTVSGASLLVNSGGSDVALLELNSTPPANYGVYYSGWDATGDTPANQTCIHHPSGDVKKISFDDQSAGMSNWGGAACWHIFAWDDGTTEPGSSGSGLWNEDHRLIGQLYGGTASCSNNVDDYFGRFNVSYPLLQPHLGNCGPTLDGYDPNGNPVALDASVQSIQDVDQNYCNVNTIAPSALIKNVGTTTLTSLTILYDLDGGSPTSLPWSGSLTTGATANVPLGSISVTNGNHTLNVWCDAPNGGTDLNTANDLKTQDFSVASPGQTITLQIVLDNYPEETTWQLEAQGGGVIATGGPYGSEPDGSTLTIPWCLGDGCFDLTFFDDAGDGICCGYGIGNFSVFDAFGFDYVTNDGQFATTVTESFCLTNTGIVQPAAASAMVRPNPADQTLSITLPQGADRRIVMTDALGRTVLDRAVGAEPTTELDVAGLSEGIYQVAIQADGSTTIARVVIRR